MLGGFGGFSALAGAPHSRGLGDQLGGGMLVVAGLAGLSHMPGRCSRLSWAQLPLVSSLTLRGVENKASFCLGQLPGPEWGWGTPDPQSWPNPGGVCFVPSCGGWGWRQTSDPTSCHLLDTGGLRATVP